MPALGEREATARLRVVRDDEDTDEHAILPGRFPVHPPPAPPPALVAPVTGRTQVCFQVKLATGEHVSDLVSGELEMLLREDGSWQLTSTRQGHGALTRSGDATTTLADFCRQLRVDLGLLPTAS